MYNKLSSGQDPKGLFDPLVELDGFERPGWKSIHHRMVNLSGLPFDNNNLIPSWRYNRK
jgi:hypothetical protein